MSDTESFLRQVIALATANVGHGGLPFAAIVVKAGQMVASGVNETARTHDPTAHAELLAVRAASQRLSTADLVGCEVYASGHPCPMCMAAMRMANVDAVTYVHSNEDGEPYGFSSAAIYADLSKPVSEQSMSIRHAPMAAAGSALYAEWRRRQAEQE